MPVEALVDVVKLFNRRRKLFGFFEDVCIIRQSVLGIGIKNIGNQNLIVRDDRPSGFRNNIRAGHLRLITDVFHLVDNIVGVLFNRVIDA